MSPARVLLLAPLLIGCGASTAEPSVAVSATERRDRDIVERSGGNWDALSEADRRTLVQDLGHGDERTARMAFRGRTSKGGPPRPGP